MSFSPTLALPATFVNPPGRSPEDWVTYLNRKLEADRPTMETWWRYFVGDHPFPQVPEKIRGKVEKGYKSILARSNSNFMATVVDVQTDRCRPIGFRLGADQGFEADQDAWRVWQASQMDAYAPLAIETSFAKGRAYLSVWKHDDEEHPRIAVEDPSQCIVELEPGSMHRRRAALKTYVDEWTGGTIAELYLPGELWRFYRRGPGAGWAPMPGDDEFETTPPGYDGIPIVPLVNRPRLAYTKLITRLQLMHGGESDLADAIAIQDRINETILNRIIALWFAAFKQKWASGLAVEEEPVKENGQVVLGDDGKPLMKPVEPFDVWMDRMLAVSDPQVTFGEFGQIDLSGHLKSHERDLQDLSTIKRVPRHYLFQEGQSPSGDAIKSAEGGLVALVKRKHVGLGEGFEEAVEIARRYAGYDPAPPDAEIVWADPEYQTYGQLVDGVIKEYESGLVPWEGALEKLQYSPQQIARFRGQRNMEGLLRALEDETPEAA